MGKTLLEISKEIGVSTATISRVLNGEDCVSPETREKVLSAVEASGYEKRPRRRSAELRNKGTALIIAGQLHNPILHLYLVLQIYQIHLLKKLFFLFFHMLPLLLANEPLAP